MGKYLLNALGFPYDVVSVSRNVLMPCDASSVVHEAPAPIPAYQGNDFMNNNKDTILFIEVFHCLNYKKI